MKARFPHPARATQVREFRSLEALRAALGKRGGRVVLDAGAGFAFGGFEVAGGESSKRWPELSRILAWLASARAERSSPLIVIGGGATLDLGALAASLYRRGMPLVLVPTTLLGMVDATLGGKTAVDFESEGRLLKNFAGTFYPAAEVWICGDFLRTLPPRERVSGAGEVFKTMWIRGRAWDSAPLLRYVRTGEVSPALGRLVRECLAVKARLVEKDPLDEKRVRELLNFGHTAGHALESVTGLSHGECVLWGMRVEAGLLGRAGAQMAAECAQVLDALGLAWPSPGLGEDEWARFLGADKKTKGGRIELSVLRAPGKVVKKRIPVAGVAKALANFLP
jgi:3-dehydroquinate synthase